jgi:hypothetical protein
MISQDRLYRSFEVRADENELRVEGYAVTFDTPAIMYEYDNVQFKEVIERNSFTQTQMEDVVMNFDHEGKPVARTKNGTLNLRVDDVGVFISADLSGTEEGRRLYEEIKGGYIDKMSFAFTVGEESYNKEDRTRHINSVKRLYDVAAVSRPAYDTTSIYARSFFEAEAEKELVEAREREKQVKRFIFETETLMKL